MSLVLLEISPLLKLITKYDSNVTQKRGMKCKHKANLTTFETLNVKIETVC